MSSVDLQVTLLGLWGIPFLFATSMHFYKLMAGHILWTIGLVCNFFVLLSCVIHCCVMRRSGYTIYRATRRPLPDKTPRLVYSFFFYAHKVVVLGGGDAKTPITLIQLLYCPEPNRARFSCCFREHESINRLRLSCIWKKGPQSRRAGVKDTSRESASVCARVCACLRVRMRVLTI